MIAWSAEGELRLRRRIFLLSWSMRALFFIGVVSSAAGFLFHQYRLTFGLLLIVAAAFLVPKVSDAIEQLGSEERIMSGTRIPGFGMLANKPRDTSRLTTWIHHRHVNVEPTGDRTVRCRCGNTFDVEEFRWTANVLECEEEIDDVPAVSVDPEGGRYVLICPCGVGHYMLREK